jgi:hypothetical protein
MVKNMMVGEALGKEGLRGKRNQKLWFKQLPLKKHQCTLSPFFVLNSNGTKSFSISQGPQEEFNSSCVGFKKQLFFRVRVFHEGLMPAFDRRKHSHSHAMLLENPVRNLSKTFNYVKKQTLRFWVAEALMGSTGAVNNSFKQKNSFKQNSFKQKNSFWKYFPTAHLVNNVESQYKVLLWRHAFTVSLNHAALSVRHSYNKNNTNTKKSTNTKKRKSGSNSNVICHVIDGKNYTRKNEIRFKF